MSRIQVCAEHEDVTHARLSWFSGRIGAPSLPPNATLSGRGEDREPRSVEAWSWAAVPADTHRSSTIHVLCGATRIHSAPKNTTVGAEARTGAVRYSTSNRNPLSENDTNRTQRSRM